MRVSWDSQLGNLFRACPSPFGRGWREAPGEGRKCTLIRPFIKASPFRARASPGPPSPRGRRTRASISANSDTTGSQDKSRPRTTGANTQRRPRQITLIAAFFVPLYVLITASYSTASCSTPRPASCKPPGSPLPAPNERFPSPTGVPTNGSARVRQT